MWWLAFGTALAGYDLVVESGPIRPGRAAQVLVAGTDAAGRPLDAPPGVDAEGGAIRGPVAVRPGVWRWTLLPAVDATTVALDVADVRHTFPIEAPRASRLGVPAVVDAVVRGDAVSFVVEGAAAADLEVVPGEGRVVAVADGPGGAVVTLALDELPYPRWVPVAVSDLRVDTQPAWVAIRVRARPRIPLVAEPGARLELRVGGRPYGPFLADASGAIEARVEQYPGEAVASALVVDDLGNETRTEVPLVTQSAAALVAVASGPQLSGRPAPAVFVRGLAPGGAGPARPTCRAPTGPLPVIPLDAKTWWVPVPTSAEPVDLRLACTVGAALADVRVPVAAGVAERLALRVWPQELSTDFPFADVTVALTDARGERIAVDDVRLRAAHGAVTLTSSGGISRHAEYDGTAAVPFGADEVVAEYVAPLGAGPVEELVFGWGPADGGARMVFVRALDRARRPLAQVPVTVEVGASERALVTEADGWARTAIVASGVEPLALRAAAGRAVASSLVLPDDPPLLGPGTPDLSASSGVGLRPGRVSGISVNVAPSVLRAAPGATARVEVRLEDGAGLPITDEPVTVEASAGEVGEVRARPDGTRVAEYFPELGGRRQEVQITASTDTLHSSTSLVVEPRPVRAAVGGWIGGRTNFGALTAPAGGIELDVRVRSKVVGEALTLRAGAGLSPLHDTLDLGTGVTAEVRTWLVPLTAAVLLRDDGGRASVWGGAGFEVAPQWVDATVGGERVRGTNVAVGPFLTGGFGLRAPGGEIVFTLTGAWLPANPTGLGYRGNLGGLVGGLGYRFAL